MSVSGFPFHHYGIKVSNFVVSCSHPQETGNKSISLNITKIIPNQPLSYLSYHRVNRRSHGPSWPHHVGWTGQWHSGAIKRRGRVVQKQGYGWRWQPRHCRHGRASYSTGGARSLCGILFSLLVFLLLNI